jgi:L-histidine N-alpha-methyltransferase
LGGGQALALDEALTAGDLRLVFFPGLTIGSFEPRAARHLLRRFAELAGPDGGILIGVDLKKDRTILEPAYNDAGR